MSMAKNQFDVFERIQAIRELLKPVLSDKEMQRLSRRVLFETVTHPPRRKKLGQKVLGLM